MQRFAYRRLLAGLMLFAGLAACGQRVDKAAAADVVIFLNAARTGDRTTFEARLDRVAARDDLRAQLAELPGVKELQAQLGETMGETALDRLVSPDTVLRLEAGDDIAASMDVVRPRLRPAGGGRICLRDREVKDRCLLTFAKFDKTWKLVGLYAERQSFEPPVSATVAASEAEAD